MLATCVKPLIYTKISVDQCVKLAGSHNTNDKWLVYSSIHRSTTIFTFLYMIQASRRRARNIEIFVHVRSLLHHPFRCPLQKIYKTIGISYFAFRFITGYTLKFYESKWANAPNMDMYEAVVVVHPTLTRILLGCVSTVETRVLLLLVILIVCLVCKSFP